MPKRADHFNSEIAKQQWDRAAEGYTIMQEMGNDYSRTEFFGPAHVKLCGNVKGLSILDLGCGSGYLSRELAKQGAVVTGIDISSKMIEFAKSNIDNQNLDITYEVMDAEEIELKFNPSSFDLVTACVSLQDMPNPLKVIQATYSVLKTNGRFIICGTHPCIDMPYQEWHHDENGKKIALKVSQYFNRGPLEFQWNKKIYKYSWITTGIHAPLSDWIKWFIESGFRIKAIEEPIPSKEAISRRPELEDGNLVPFFILFDLEKE
jgi:ubiquinone/menaquinone biosynthesis C-methylase UbiE